MGKTHEPILIHDGSRDLIKIFKMACAEAKKKLKLGHDVWLTPVWSRQTPYGYVVLIELPREKGREKEAGKTLEVQRRNKGVK